MPCLPAIQAEHITGCAYVGHGSQEISTTGPAAWVLRSRGDGRAGHGMVREGPRASGQRGGRITPRDEPPASGQRFQKPAPAPSSAPGASRPFGERA